MYVFLVVCVTFFQQYSRVQILPASRVRKFLTFAGLVGSGQEVLTGRVESSQVGSISFKNSRVGSGTGRANKFLKTHGSGRITRPVRSDPTRENPVLLHSGYFYTALHSFSDLGRE